MITVSNAAKEHAINLIKEENKPVDTFIRVGVDGGGCSGLMYNLVFDNVIKEGDQLFEDNGVKVVVDRHCPAGSMYLLDTRYIGYLTIDPFFYEELAKRDSEDPNDPHIIAGESAPTEKIRLC